MWFPWSDKPLLELDIWVTDQMFLCMYVHKSQEILVFKITVYFAKEKDCGNKSVFGTVAAAARADCLVLEVFLLPDYIRKFSEISEDQLWLLRKVVWFIDSLIL